jgi:hypothetical protein
LKQFNRREDGTEKDDAVPDDIMLSLDGLTCGTDRQAVIPERAASADPESNRKDTTRGWIPGPACGRPGMTFQIDRVMISGRPDPTSS